MKITINKYRADIKKTTTLVYQKQWAEMSAGNFSIWMGRQKKPPKALFSNSILLEFQQPLEQLSHGLLLISRSCSRFRDIIRNPASHLGWIWIDASGKKGIASSSTCKDFIPSSEWWIHALSHNCLQRYQPEKVALLHAHPLYATSLAQNYPSISSEKINAFLQQSHHEMKFVFPQGIGITSPHKPGSNKLAQETAQCFADYALILWPRHGIISAGKTLEEAFDLMDIAEKNAQLSILGNLLVNYI